MRKNILSYLEETVKRVPNKLAFSNGKEGMTFSELYDASCAIGSELCRCGAKGEPVVIFMDKHPKTLAAFFGKKSCPFGVFQAGRKLFCSHSLGDRNGDVNRGADHRVVASEP